MDKKKRKATKAQRERIKNMLESGLIDRDEAQEIIDKPRVNPDKSLDPNAFWEEKFPGNGGAITDVLRPFYGWQPVLRAAIPCLEERSRQAICWRELNDIRVLCAARETSLWHSCQRLIKVSLMDSLKDPSHELSQEWLRARLLSSLEASLKVRFTRALWDSLDAMLQDCLRGSLWVPCCLAVAGKLEEAAKFKPLLDLWLAGNFPVGFDAEGNLLVLVVD